MNVAQVIARTLYDEGVDCVFSLLGEATMNVVSELHRLGARVVEVRHEAVAMAMADGYSRASGKPTLCAVTTGPAFAHTLVPLTSAGRSGSRVIVLTGLRSLDDLEDRQRMDHPAIARVAGVTHLPLTDPDAAVERVHAAVDHTLSGGGPVVLDVAQQVQEQPYDWDLTPRPRPQWRRPQRIQPDPTVLGEAVELIMAAQRPVVLAGAGAVASDSHQALTELAASIGALVCTTLDARTWFDGDPFNAGVAGLYSSDVVTTLFSEADLVISFGAGLNAHTLTKGYLFGAARYIQVDIASPRPMRGGGDADCYVQGDVQATAIAVRTEVQRRGGRADQPGYRTPENAARLAGVEIDPVPVDTAPGELDPRAVCATIDAALPSEVGFATGLSGHFWSFTALHMTRRRTTMLFSTRVGAIGYGVPVGIGATLAEPDRPMVIFEGDGSVMMNVHALETAARQQARALIVIMNNQALGAELYKMDLHGLSSELSLAPGLDVAAIASAMGCTATVATELGQVEDFVQAFLAGTGPYVLDARISRAVMSRTFRRANLGEA